MLICRLKPGLQRQGCPLTEGAYYIGESQDRFDSHGDIAVEDSLLVDEIADGRGELGVLQRDFPLPLQHDRKSQPQRRRLGAIRLNIAAGPP
jgi:hypothetical protein